MAKLIGEFQFEGSIGNLSAYKRKDSDKIILRTKGGPSKRRIKTAPEFAVVRLYNLEWNGCAKMSAAIRNATNGIRRLSDYNTSTKLNTLNKILQKTDNEHPLGERALYLSQNKEMLVGFNLNKNTLLDSVFSARVKVAIDRDAMRLTLHIPKLIPDVNIKQYGRNSYYRLIVTLGVVSDMVCEVENKNYVPLHNAMHGVCNTFLTNWHAVHQEAPEQTIMHSLVYSEKLTENESLVVGFGIEYGNPLSDTVISLTKNAGFAKIIAVE